MIPFIKNYRDSRKGNISIISGAGITTIAIGAVYVVDYGLYVHSKQELASAAAAAALSAANEAHISYKDREDIDLEQLIIDTATNTFNAQTGHLNFASVSNLDVKPTVINNEFTVDVKFDAQYPSIAPGLPRKKIYHINNRQSATVSAAAFISVNLVFDVSASMGVGATVADQEIVNTIDNCAFTCHIGASGPTDPNSTYVQARNAGADMRIDVAREAAIHAVNSIENTLELEDQVAFGIYTFDNELNTIMESVDADAVNFDAVETAIEDNIFMNTIGGGTNMTKAIHDIKASLPVSGSGRIPSERIQYIVVLTDGVEGTLAYGPNKFFDGNRTINGTNLVPPSNPQFDPNNPAYRHNPTASAISYAMSSTFCDSFRADGTNLYFIHTEYLIPTLGSIGGAARSTFNFIGDTLNDVITQRFETCAGGDQNNVITASDPDEINQGFGRLLQELSSPLRIFNNFRRT